MSQGHWLAPRLTIVLICLLLSLADTSTASKEEEPTISLVKTVIIRDYKGLKISSDEYRVQKGDYLLKLLQQRGVIHELIPRKEIMDLIKTLNPDLKNPNIIFPGQKLILPTGPIKGLKLSPLKATSTQIEKIGIPYRIQRVKPGERLVLFLRREGLPDKLIFNEYIDLVMKLNPEIKDKDIIYPGQKIRLPIIDPSVKTAEVAQAEKPLKPSTESAKAPQAKSPPKAEKKPSAAPQEKTRADQQRPSPPLSAKTPVAKPKKLAKGKKTLVLKPPQLPESETLAMQAALGIIFSRIG
ncbi:MAG: LysM peptidoglycan-binding domain-containing protein, partial [Deltaproteobacteria bacterium]|nr:LysM peptidoglycan-binding domain-containing protein [Deltaproteobacteria bacterium]